MKVWFLKLSKITMYVYACLSRKIRSEQHWDVETDVFGLTVCENVTLVFELKHYSRKY